MLLFLPYLGENKGQRDELVEISQFNIYIALMALPGYLLSFLLVDYLGRKFIQIFGFVCMGILYVLLGVLLEVYDFKDTTWLAVILYGATFFFSNFGPNTTTFILPSETFPTEIRARCAGISAAAGKFGNFVFFLFPPIPFFFN